MNISNSTNLYNSHFLRKANVHILNWLDYGTQLVFESWWWPKRGSSWIHLHDTFPLLYCGIEICAVNDRLDMFLFPLSARGEKDIRACLIFIITLFWPSISIDQCSFNKHCNLTRSDYLIYLPNHWKSSSQINTPTPDNESKYTRVQVTYTPNNTRTILYCAVM